MDIKIKTLTPLWTGGAKVSHMDRLHESSIIGSLRWWYETLVRGLGGWACDPTSKDGCPDKHDKRCAACELFGCTGWQRKFKLQILDTNDMLFNRKISSNYGLEEGAILVLRFLELRPVDDEERWLLQQTIRIAAQYGAIGGRTPRKPQKNKKIAGDYGIFTILEQPEITTCDKVQVRFWLKHSNLRRINKSHWPDLRCFFFVSDQYLKRLQINELIGLSPNGRSIIQSGAVEKALRGRQGESKKVFSFETPSVQRLWGYAPDKKVQEQIIDRLKELGIYADNIRTGEEVLNAL